MNKMCKQLITICKKIVRTASVTSNIKRLSGVLLLVLILSLQARAQNQQSSEQSQAVADSVWSMLQQTAGGGPVIQLGDELTRTPDELTAATSIVRSDVLSKSELTLNAENALYGRLNGLMVLRNGGGNPPADATLFVRGRSTFSNSSPLVLVDGFERPLQSVTEIGGPSVDEIASVTVLKDAAALAKYGQRGANGAILVTTKRGERGDLGVRASYEQGITQPKGMPSMADASTYARAINEARSNDGMDPRYSQAEVQKFDSGNSPYLYPNVDWFDQTLRNTGTRANFNVSVNGGGDRARYFVMGNFVGDNGIYGPVNRHDDYSTQTKYRRFNFRTNLDINLTDNILFQTDVSGNIVEHNIPGGGAGTSNIFNALYSVPSAAFPVKTPNGTFGGTQTYGNNPVAQVTSTGYGQPNSRQFSLTGRLRRDMSDVVEGLSAEVGISYFNLGDFSERKTQNYSYQSFSPVLDQQGNVVDTTTTTYGQDTDLSFYDAFDNEQEFTDLVGKLNYETQWNDDNRLTAMVRYHQSSREYDGRDNVFHRQNLAGNVHVGLSKTYFFDVSASYSGNNIIDPGNRFGFFPAVSAGWMLSKERFLADADFLNRLKVRVSYGLTGSDNLPTSHLYEQNYLSSGSGYWFTNGNSYQGGFYEGPAPTADFTYEISHKTDLGIEGRIFEKLQFTADLFYDHRTNILTSSGGQVSNVFGNTPSQESVGIVDNKGVETSLQWTQDVGDFGYQIGGKLLVSKNEIKNEDEQYRPNDNLKRTGRQVGQRFGLKAIGFFKDQQEINNSPTQTFSDVQPGDVKYKDQNGDDIINSFDEVPLGHASGYPEIYFSATVGAHYKNVGFSALIQGTGNYTGYLNTQSVFWPLQGNTTISNYYYNHRWTPQTASQATLPRLTSEGSDNNYRSSSLWMIDKSYVKLRNVEVYYSLPTSVTHRLMVRDIKIYARGLNLLSIDDVPVFDPEQISTGYPLMRTYSLGIKMKF